MNLFIDKNVIVLLVGFFVCGTSYADTNPTDLQSISVTVHAGTSQGSGVIKVRGDTCYIWTAAHVVAGLRSTRQVIDPKTGSTKTIVEFKDARIVPNEFVEDGRSVDRHELDAEIIRYSDADNGEDLALFRIRRKNFTKSSVNFFLEDTLPPIGSDLFHVGSLHGQTGSNSVTDGIISRHGRVHNEKVYDQSNCAAFPGSSGGGVFLKKDGQYIGMIVRGTGETFNLMVPIRRMRTWAKSSGIEFALDDKIHVPSIEEIRKGGVEQIGVILQNDARTKPKELSIPTRIFIKPQEVLPRKTILENGKW